MVTHKMIRNDISEIVRQLKEVDAEIPSLLSSFKSGFVAAVVIILIQVFSYAHAFLNGATVSNTYLFSLLFSCALGLFVFLVTTSTVSKFLSIPYKIRQESLIFQTYAQVCKRYIKIWCIINVLSLILVNAMGLDPFVTYGTQFLSMVILFIIYTIDLGRYDFTIFHSVISAWRNGKLEGDISER